MLTVYKQTHLYGVCVCACVCVSLLNLKKKKKEKKEKKSTDCLTSWGLEAPFESTTVVDLKVKVPPGVVSSGKKKKKATEDLLLGASSNTWMT